MLQCPICTLALKEEEKRCFCENGHSFDRARQGHLNLLMDSSHHGHGDDRKMLSARRAFLDAGHYQMLSDRICKILCERFPFEGVLLDAGCGEGYYTKAMFDALSASEKRAELYAFDIAKDAARLTSSRLCKKGHVFVASTFHIPMFSECVDFVTSLFAPYSEEEFLRILKPGAHLLRAVPLEHHLYELKCAIYDEPKKNETAAQIGPGFRLCGEERISGTIFLSSGEEIRALFEMTPYAHKTAKEDIEKLAFLQTLETQVDFGILLYEKL